MSHQSLTSAKLLAQSAQLCTAYDYGEPPEKENDIIGDDQLVSIRPQCSSDAEHNIEEDTVMTFRPYPTSMHIPPPSKRTL